MSSFWLNDPFVLLRKEHIMELWPSPKMTTNEKLNATTRLVILLSLLGYLCAQSTRFVLVGVLTVAAIVVFYIFSEKKLLKEGLATINNTLDRVEYGNNTIPTTSNPMMNILLTDYKDRPTRKPALEVNAQTASVINDKVKTKVLQTVQDPRIFRGIDNEAEFEHSMRNFYTTANTSIPNDQKGFSEYCYGEMLSAKEGNAAALLKYNARLGQVTV